MRDAVDVKVKNVRIGLKNVRARLPFRFGAITVHSVTSATVAVDVETRDGARATGYAADFLSHAWFDKRPGRSPEAGTRDLLDCVVAAGRLWADADHAPAFYLWRDLHEEFEHARHALGQNPLSANFGTSMIERGVIDAVGHLTGQGFHDLVRGPALGISEVSVFPELVPGTAAGVLPAVPRPRLLLRHTVGLVDPLTADDLTKPIGDGLPETLEGYLQAHGLQYLKVKISADLDETLDRLTAIQALCSAAKRPVQITLDGNEQFPDMQAFFALTDRIRAAPALQQLWDNTVFIEQPVERSAALDAGLDPKTISAIGKPLIIDESDSRTRAFHDAMALGYRGVSHKNCKGVFRALLNYALAAHRNAQTQGTPYFMSAEDLSCLPFVSLNADLCVAASLGIGHIERNGHHYFRRLEHLSRAEQATAADYAGLYQKSESGWALAVRDGSIDASGLTAPGFGLRHPPELDGMLTPHNWRFDA